MEKANTCTVLAYFPVDDIAPSDEKPSLERWRKLDLENRWGLTEGEEPVGKKRV